MEGFTREEKEDSLPQEALADTIISDSLARDKADELAKPITLTVTGPTPVCGDVLTDTVWPSLGSPYFPQR